MNNTQLEEALFFATTPIAKDIKSIQETHNLPQAQVATWVLGL